MVPSRRKHSCVYRSSWPADPSTCREVMHCLRVTPWLSSTCLCQKLLTPLGTAHTPHLLISLQGGGAALTCLGTVISLAALSCVSPGLVFRPTGGNNVQMLVRWRLCPCLQENLGPVLTPRRPSKGTEYTQTMGLRQLKPP